MSHKQRWISYGFLKRILFVLALINHSYGYLDVIFKLDNLDPGISCNTDFISGNETDHQITSLLIDEQNIISLNYEEPCQCSLTIVSQLDSNVSITVTIETLQEETNSSIAMINTTISANTTWTEPQTINHTEQFYTMSAAIVEKPENLERYLVSEMLQQDYRIPVLLSFDQPVILNINDKCLTNATQDTTVQSSEHMATETSTVQTSKESLDTTTQLFNMSTNHNMSKSDKYLSSTPVLHHYTQSTEQMVTSNYYTNQSQPTYRTSQLYFPSLSTTENYKNTTNESPVVTDQDDTHSTLGISIATKTSILYSTTEAHTERKTGMTDDDETLLIAIIIALIGLFLLGTCMVFVLIRKRKKGKRWQGRTESMYGIEGVINAYDESATSYQITEQDYMNGNNNNDPSYKVPEPRGKELTTDVMLNSLTKPIMHGRQAYITSPDTSNKAATRPNELNLFVPPQHNLLPVAELNQDLHFNNQYNLSNTDYYKGNQFHSHGINNKPNNFSKKNNPNIDLKKRFQDMTLPEIAERKESIVSSHYASTEIFKTPLPINTNIGEQISDNAMGTDELDSDSADSAPSLPPKNPKVLLRSKSAIQKSDLSPIYVGDIKYPRVLASTNTGSTGYPHYANISNLHHPKVSALYSESQPTAFADINLSEVNRKGKRSKRPHSFSNDYSDTDVYAIQMNPYDVDKPTKGKGSSSTYERHTGNKPSNKSSKLYTSNSLRIPKLSSEEVAELYALPVKPKRSTVTEKKSKSFNGSSVKSDDPNQSSLKKNPYFFEVI